MLPTVTLGNAQITRFVIGGNPFSGNSHVNKAMNDEMKDYFTTAKIKETLYRCIEHGINTMQVRSDMHLLRIMLEFRNEGGKMHWIAQPASELASFDNNIKQIAASNAIAIYHHGSVTDQLFKAGEYAELVRRLEVIRATGLPVGLGTHMPRVIEYAEEHKWGVDFYMACVYNLSRIDRISSAITGKDNEGEPFFEEDIPVMYKMIRQVQKPCIAFKILGSTRRCQNQETVKKCFFEAYQNIKETDVVLAGMFPKEIDQVKLNCEYAAQAIEAAKAGKV